MNKLKIILLIAQLLTLASSEEQTGAAIYNSIDEIDCKCVFAPEKNSCTINAANLGQLSSELECQTSSGHQKVSYFNEIELIGYNSEEFPKIILEKLHVKKLIVTNSAITNIEEDAFSFVAGDEDLEVDLSFNHIERVDLKAFHTLKGKERELFVNMHNNQIGEVVPVSYDTGRFKTHLNISNNRLQIVEIGNSAVELDLSFNSITDLICYENVSAVENLDLYSNKLRRSESFYNCMSRLINLEFLDLSFNKLSESIAAHDDHIRIETFSEMTKLKSLSLAGNGLQSISYGLLSRQYELESLDLSYNKFTSFLFGRFVTLTKLIVIDFSFNNFRDADDFLKVDKYLTSIKYLGLEGTNLPCWDLAYLKRKLKARDIELMQAEEYVKNETNIDGIKCLIEFGE